MPASFRAHLIIDGCRLGVGVFLTIISDPSPWYQVFPLPCASDFVDIEMLIGRALPVRPHRGKFVECDLINPFSCLPGLNNRCGDLRIYHHPFPDQWVCPVLYVVRFSAAESNGELRALVLTNPNRASSGFW